MKAHSKMIIVLLPACWLVLSACSTQQPGRTILDMTYPLDDAAIFWPTAKPFSLTKVGWAVADNGRWYASNEFSASEHGGTHADAPIHFAAGGRTIDQVPLEEWIGPAVKVDVSAKCAQDRDYPLPGLFPGRVVEVQDAGAVKDDKVIAKVVYRMFEKGLGGLTQKSGKDSFALLFCKDDVVGIKVNPVGPGTISTHHEVVDALIDWLVAGGLRRGNIIIWDRFDYMLKDAGFTPERYPGVGIEGLQTMDEAAAMGKTQDNSRWLRPDGTHVSVDNFDQEAYYWADVEGPKDNAYLNQHVFNGKFSYFGKLLTKRLTKIINVPVFKNTGNGISMATKNLGYGAVCNTNRLHMPLFFDVNTEVMAFPVIRDKLVLNITDGLRGQYEGGPEYEAKFAYWLNTLYLSTDPFALDMVCHRAIVAKRKSMGIKVNEHPKFTDYLRYAERLGLGVVDPGKVQHVLI